jgi:group I intron endonuclease
LTTTTTMTTPNIGIYQLRNIITGNKYVGRSANLHRRKNDHFSNMRRNAHRNTRVQADHDAHGVESFVFELLEYVDADALRTAEQRHLDRPEFTYNIARKATGGYGDGYSHTDESREKIRQARIGTKQTDEARARQSETRKSMDMKGADSCRFGGYFVTPWGKFGSSYQAVENQSITQPSVWKWCKNPDGIICRKAFAKSAYLKALGEGVIGQTPRSLGFSFEPASA